MMPGVAIAPRGAYRAGRRLLPVLLSLMLAGCAAVGPDYKGTSAPVPKSWGGKTTAADAQRPDLSQWWQRLNDPVLNQIVASAIAGNLDLATSRAKIREARASLRETGGEAGPQLDGSGAATRSDSGGTGAGNAVELGFDASWEIDLFGGNRRAIEAQAYALQAADADMRDTMVTLIGDVASYYIEARSDQARIALARRTAASQRETQKLTEAMLKAGSASALDAAQARGTAATTEADVPDLETDYAESVHRLSLLTGQPPRSLAALMAKTRPIPVPRLPVPRGVPADILTARPDVRAAERALAQSTALIGVAEAQRYPSISLTGSIATTGGQIGDLAKSSSIGWSFGPGISIPLFHSGALKAAVDVAKAERDQAFLTYRATVLTALEDVENASVALTQDQRKYARLQEAASAYRQALTLSQSLYKSGSLSFLDLLDSERSLYSAESSLIQSRAAITTDYVSLMKALGGGWNGLAGSAGTQNGSASK